jgi:hypothetical protein
VAGPAQRRATTSKGGRDVAPRSAPKRKDRTGAAARSSRRPAARPVRAIVPVVGGLLWGLLLAAVLSASSVLTALVLVPMAVIATVSGVRAAERAKGRPARSRRSARSAGGPSPALLGGAALCVVAPLLALGGPMAALVVLVLGGGAVAVLVLSSVFAASARPLRAVLSLSFAALAPAVAATSLVIARHQGSDLALALAGATVAYDAGAFLMGHGRSPLGGPVGVLFGGLSVAVIAVFVAALMNPPFSGNRPWIVFAAVAVLAPIGVWLGQVAFPGERLPAVRRLDSLSMSAPFWVLAVALLLHR